MKKTTSEQRPDEARPDLTITQYDDQGRPTRRVKLTNAYATGSSLDASGGDPAQERVTIAYEAITVE